MPTLGSSSSMLKADKESFLPVPGIKIIQILLAIFYTWLKVYSRVLEFTVAPRKPGNTTVSNGVLSGLKSLSSCHQRCMFPHCPSMISQTVTTGASKWFSRERGKVQVIPDRVASRLSSVRRKQEVRISSGAKTQLRANPK